MNARTIALSIPLLFSGGCGHGHAEGGGSSSHEHEAIHDGGVMVEVGAHLAQLEVRVDPAASTFEFWFWDHGEAIRLAHETLEVEVSVGGTTVVFPCAAQASQLTGETVGDSSEFRGSHAVLSGADHVEGAVLNVNVRGTMFERLEFHWPAEDDHDH